MQKVYEVMDFADCAYILRSGKLVFEITPQDKYTLEGREIIFGAEEPIIRYKTGREDYLRFQTVWAEEGSRIDKIPANNLYKVLSLYNIGYNLTKNIARFVQITNRMYISKEKKLSGVEMASKEYASIYVDVIERLKSIYQKLKIRWLAELIEKYINSLVYTKGLAFKGTTSRSELKLDTNKLSEYTFNVRAGSILCEEGDKTNEMFILNRGNLAVFIGGKKVADINEPGTVIGEMALLLGETRSATIKAITESNLTIVKPENLKSVAEANKEFFLNIAFNLSRNLEHNCTLIRETNELLQSRSSEVGVAPPSEKTNYKQLLSMMRELERFELKYKNEWMSEILKFARDEISKVRKMYS